jgi:hypothetical protein
MARFVEERDINAWWKVMGVNVKAPIAMIRAVLPGFIKRGKGTVITVGSAAADLPLVFQSSYDALKAAVQKAIQILDMELREEGILNFVIHPGNIETDLNQGSAVVGQDMKELMDSWAPYMIDTLELPAQSMVALAVFSLNAKEKEGDDSVEVLSGRYWDVQDDLEEILTKKAEIEERDLYQLTSLTRPGRALVIGNYSCCQCTQQGNHMQKKILHLLSAKFSRNTRFGRSYKGEWTRDPSMQVPHILVSRYQPLASRSTRFEFRLLMPTLQ